MTTKAILVYLLSEVETYKARIKTLQSLPNADHDTIRRLYMAQMALEEAMAYIQAHD